MVDSKNFVKKPLVFTLGDDEPVSAAPVNPQPVAAMPSAATQAHEETVAMLAGWEQKLERLMRDKARREGASAAETGRGLQVEDVFSHAAVSNRGERQGGKNIDWAQWEKQADAPKPRQEDKAPAPAPVQATHAIKTREAKVHLSPLKPIPSASVEASSLPDPIQRERAYRAYLRQWQEEYAREQAEQDSLLNDTAVLIEEDWLAAQECLQVADGDEAAACVVRLGAEPEADAVLPPTEENKAASAELEGDAATSPEAVAQADAAVTHVHMHVAAPRSDKQHLVTCVSETELLQHLQEKLRPHLSDAVSGMVKVVIQKQTAQLVTQLQQQLLAEVPDLVDEVLQHNLQQAMEQVKTELRKR